ncbi:PTS sugar transporter subunit IIA [Mycoplasmopsis primatum]|uniref:PTS sugar transporter subunit IIA n=1 Tax=Mycoplasmopsis primatum TaxID=55604 RepID=UPI000495987B|nr:PTS sugar transporter subunit IIA [Mycoplasmopsis primatum]
MTKKDKFIIVLLTIITLGFCWLHWHIKNKKIQQIKKGEIKKLDPSIKIDELISLLGSSDNITAVESSISTLKCTVKNKDLINVEKIKSLKYVTGIMVSTSRISLVVGDYAKKINEIMNQEFMNK